MDTKIHVDSFYLVGKKNAYCAGQRIISFLVFKTLRSSSIDPILGYSLTVTSPSSIKFPNNLHDRLTLKLHGISRD